MLDLFVLHPDLLSAQPGGQAKGGFGEKLGSINRAVFVNSSSAQIVIITVNIVKKSIRGSSGALGNNPPVRMHHTKCSEKSFFFSSSKIELLSPLPHKPQINA